MTNQDETTRWMLQTTRDVSRIEGSIASIERTLSDMRKTSSDVFSRINGLPCQNNAPESATCQPHSNKKAMAAGGIGGAAIAALIIELARQLSQ